MALCVDGGPADGEGNGNFVSEQPASARRDQNDETSLYVGKKFVAE